MPLTNQYGAKLSATVLGANVWVVLGTSYPGVVIFFSPPSPACRYSRTASTLASAMRVYRRQISEGIFEEWLSDDFTWWYCMN